MGDDGVNGTPLTLPCLTTCLSRGRTDALTQVPAGTCRNRRAEYYTLDSGKYGHRVNEHVDETLPVDRQPDVDARYGSHCREPSGLPPRLPNG